MSLAGPGQFDALLAALWSLPTLVDWLIWAKETELAELDRHALFKSTENGPEKSRNHNRLSSSI